MYTFLKSMYCFFWVILMHRFGGNKRNVSGLDTGKKKLVINPGLSYYFTGIC